MASGYEYQKSFLISISLPRAFAVLKREILLPVMSKTAQRETWE